LPNGEKNRDELVQSRRHQIIAAARKVFAQKGYRCTKTEDIAAELGVGKGTLYRYFKDKEALFLAVDEEGFGRLEAEAERLVYSAGDPREGLKAIVKCFYEFFDREGDLIEIEIQMRSEFKDVYEQRFTEGQSKHTGRIAEMLREGTAKGYFRNVDAVMGAKALSALLYGSLLGFYYGRSGERLADYVTPMTDFVMHGFFTGDESIQSAEGNMK
jgi:AcrR family transcriptional regulator